MLISWEGISSDSLLLSIPWTRILTKKRNLGLLINAVSELGWRSLITSRKLRSARRWPGWCPELRLRAPSRKENRSLAQLINACFRPSYFPKKWQTVTIIVIPKPGKDSSRVDGLLSGTSKVFDVSCSIVCETILGEGRSGP